MKNKIKPYHLLVYVEDSNLKIKKFKTTRSMGEFMDKFLKNHPDYASNSGDSWLEFSVTNVTGGVDFFTTGIELK